MSDRKRVLLLPLAVFVLWPVTYRFLYAAWQAAGVEEGAAAINAGFQSVVLFLGCLLFAIFCLSHTEAR